MERSIGCRMAELEQIKGYNCTKTAIIYLKSGFCEKKYLCAYTALVNGTLPNSTNFNVGFNGLSKLDIIDTYL